MYLSTERVAPYPMPARPVFTGARRKAVQLGRKILTACLGREFMELSARHKVNVLYSLLSLLSPICFLNEERPWQMLLLIANLANAVRVANRVVKTSARD